MAAIKQMNFSFHFVISAPHQVRDKLRRESGIFNNFSGFRFSATRSLPL